MKTNYINLSSSPVSTKPLSGNFNYGLFCGKKDTIEKGCEFLYDILKELVDSERIGKYIVDFRNYCNEE